MDVIVALTGYDRITDRLVFEHEIPEGLVRRALAIARVNPRADNDWRDVRLSNADAERIAHELKKKIDAGPEYFLEFSLLPKKSAAR
jgi:hypothetical protein